MGAPVRSKSMHAARPSLAWKIATANILLALFAVLLGGMLQYRKEQRIIRKIQLAAGDTLLLVTDGVVEALGPDRDHFQMDKLAEIFRQADSDASQLVEDIFEEISRVCSTPPQDDLTVLAVTWTPQQMGVRK